MTGAPAQPAASVSGAYHLRPALQEESALIHSMVRGERLNPMGISWQRFILAVTTDGTVIGCAQMKPHNDGSRELSSLIVAPAWRGKGVARSLIEILLDENPGTIYLTCRSTLEPLYQRFGFQNLVDLAEMPPYFRRIMHLFGIIRGLRLTRERLLVMRLIREEKGNSQPGSTPSVG